MKAVIFVKLMLVAVICSLFSCKDVKNPLSTISGGVNEVLVVMNNEWWDGPVGDSVKLFLSQDQPGLPQPEPIFDVLHLPISFFDKNLKSHRNVLIVEISASVDSNALIFTDSPWARTQKYFRIQAKNPEAFYPLFDENKERIMGVFLKAERDRLAAVYKKTGTAKIMDLFKNKYQILLSCPEGYNINKDTTDFIWISRETQHDSRGVVFFQEEYVNEGQFNYMVIQEKVNDILKAYIPGPLKGSYMILNTVAPISSVTYNYDGRFYAVLQRGLWEVENDFMGGPFILNVVLDKAENRVLYMFGYVYAPEDKKRNMLRQVESVVFTMDIEAPEAPKKESK